MRLACLLQDKSAFDKICWAFNEVFLSCAGTETISDIVECAFISFSLHIVGSIFLQEKKSAFIPKEKCLQL